MLYTSGTTGRPKGVWRGVLSEEHARAWAEDERELWTPDPDATFLVCSPLYHSAGYRSATAVRRDRMAGSLESWLRPSAACGSVRFALNPGSTTS